MTEQQLWKQWRVQLRGFWNRVEVQYPEGFPDVYGVFEGIGQFLELKVGPPRPGLLRPSQVCWLIDWWTAGGEAYVMVGDEHRVQFFRDVKLAVPIVPAFWRS